MDETIDRDATVRVAYFAPLTGWDPAHLASGYQQLPYHLPVYDRLLQLSAENEVEPMLATAWEFSDDLLTLTLELRTDVVFHDGVPLDADAAKRSLDRATETLSTGLDVDLSAVSSVDALDDFTLQVSLSRRDPALLHTLAHYGGMVFAPSIVGEEDFSTQPVGSGPYRPVLSETTQTMVVLERFEDYWDPDAARAARIEISSVPDELTRLNAMRAGEYDLTNLAPANVPAAREIPGVAVYEYETISNLIVTTNLATSEALAIPEVRRALSLAIDREAVADQLLEGLCTPTTQPFAPGVPGYIEELDQEVVFDPASAEQLLAQVGVADLELTMNVPNVEPFQSLGQVIQAQWAQVGVNLQVQVYSGGEASAALGEGIGNIGTVPQPGGPVSARAIAEYARRNYDQIPADLAARADEAAELDPLGEEAAELYEEINLALVDTPVGFTVCRLTNTVVAGDNVLGADSLSWLSLSPVFDPSFIGIAAE